MIWAYVAVGIAAAYFEENPDLIAKLAFELQIKRSKGTLPLKYLYLIVRYIHERVHGAPPQRAFDKLALAAWIKGSKLVDESVSWLDDRTSSQPTWETAQDRLVQSYKAVFPTKPKTGRKLGKADIDWVSLGFQGADPCADFRAAGMLGLEQFEAFCVTSTKDAQRLVEESGSAYPSDSPLWYSLALASIHLSNSLAHKLRDEPVLIACVAGTSMDFETIFSSVHNGLLVSFHHQWLRESEAGTVRSVMDTDACLKRFETRIPQLLWEMRT